MGIFDRIAGTFDELAREAVTPGDVREEIALDLAYAERGDLTLAEERLRELAARYPNVGAVQAALGAVQAQRGDVDAAISSYGRAVDCDGDDARHWFALGTLLARAHRFEPARDALRKTLALSLDASVRGQAHAALGQLYAADGQLGRAARELQKALAAAGGEGDSTLTTAYGRVLAAAGEPAGSDWLARAARGGAGDPALFIEAAAAAGDDGAAEALLREGLSRAPTHAGLRAALARRLSRNGRAAEGLTLALESLRDAPTDAAVLAAVRESFAATGRWADALAAAQREAELGAPPPLGEAVALALGAHAREALEAVLTIAAPRNADETALVSATRAFLEPALPPPENDLRRLARLAPDEAARRFVVRRLAPPPAPAGNLFALLTYAHDLAVRMPAPASLAVGAGRAAEALDRPLLVAVMGEFNAGKSSFVNALVGEAIAPVGVTPTTATVNILRHGSPGGRVVYQDGTARELGATSVGPFLRELGDTEAAAVRFVEIFHPLEMLRRVEVVDTPGLNSLRPEHEKVARDFLVDADAIVWLFAVGQAAKATEKQALQLAHDAGKRVLGVVSKVDRADAAEIVAVIAHVRAAVGDLVSDIVPLAPRAALAARQNGDAAALAASGLPAVEEALEAHFFRDARTLKRATALAALHRFVADARAAATAAAAPTPDFAAQHAALSAAEERLRGALGAERVALRARIEEAYRGAAFEVRDFVRPRAWLFGEHRAERADEEFLVDLLDEAIGRATAATRAALVGALCVPDADAPVPDFAASATDAIDAAVDRFAAYARGVIESGAVAAFFRQDLPRIRLDVAAIRNALARHAPDPEPSLFAPLGRALERLGRDAVTRLAAAEAEAAVSALIADECVARPLADIARALDALATAAPLSPQS